MTWFPLKYTLHVVPENVTVTCVHILNIDDIAVVEHHYPTPLYPSDIDPSEFMTYSNPKLVEPAGH